MERSLAWDQDHQHNVPSSSQTKRCHAVPRGIAELKSYDSKRSCRDTKKAPKLRGESGHKKHKAPESMADSVWLKRSAGRTETGDPTGTEETEDDCWRGSVQTTEALFTAAQVTSDTKPSEHSSLQVNHKIKRIKTSANVQYFQMLVLKINIKIQDV